MFWLELAGGCAVIARILSALAEPTRLEAVYLLRDGRERCVCDLMEALLAKQSRMSRHMQVLKQAGLVVDRRDAQWVRCRLNEQLAEEMKAALDAVIAARRTQERNAA